MSLAPKEQYAQMVCLFLAEALRTRRISLQRAAEIAEKFLQNLSLLDTENDFLSLIKELAKDFDELDVLESRVAKSKETTEKRRLESLVKEFVIGILATDVKMAMSILQDASTDNAKLSDLGAKYPAFKNYLSKNDQ
jgi:signal transduction histidine kinase